MKEKPGARRTWAVSSKEEGMLAWDPGEAMQILHLSLGH